MHREQHRHLRGKQSSASSAAGSRPVGTQPVVAQVAELQGEQEQRDSDKIRWQESKDQARCYKNSQGKEK